MAEGAPLAGGIEIRELVTTREATEAAALIDRIWGEERIVTPAFLRALATHGAEVLGAYRGTELVGAQVAFVGLTEEGTILHSHITGVRPDAQGAGVGLALKLAQRRWCLDRGIDVVTWTFDPMVARNAYFNLQKLGAVADRFHRDFYGDMPDAFNVGDRSDRLEVRWRLPSDRVRRALEEGLPEPDPADAPVVVDGEESRPITSQPPEGARLLVRIPDDYHALKGRDLQAARAWRDAVADALEDALARGYRATGFSTKSGYLLERG